MNVLKLPVEGWALAYPDPRYDTAHLMHTPCGWRSDVTAMPEFWRHHLTLIDHKCSAAVTGPRWCPRCGQPFQVHPVFAAPHILCGTCSANNPDRRVRDRFRALMGRR